MQETVNFKFVDKPFLALFRTFGNAGNSAVITGEQGEYLIRIPVVLTPYYQCICFPLFWCHEN